MQAKQLMTREVILIDPSTTLTRAYELMQKHAVRHLPVASDLRLLGVISDRDLLRVGTPEHGGLVFDHRTVNEIMATSLITGTKSTTVSDLAGLMIDHKIDSVPIVSPTGNIVGLVTSTDLLGLLREDDRSAKVIPFDFRLRPAGDMATA